MSYMLCCLLYMSSVFQQNDKSLITIIIKNIVYFILFIKHILSNLWIQKTAIFKERRVISIVFKYFLSD